MLYKECGSSVTLLEHSYFKNYNVSSRNDLQLRQIYLLNMTYLLHCKIKCNLLQAHQAEIVYMLLVNDVKPIRPQNTSLGQYFFVFHLYDAQCYLTLIDYLLIMYKCINIQMIM